MNDMRDDAVAIWQAAVAAVDPFELTEEALGVIPAGITPAARQGLPASLELRTALNGGGRIIVVGAGKAGARMAAGAEAALADRLAEVQGLINVPADSARPLNVIRLHAARPAGSNHPTAEGVAGAREILSLVGSAGAEDICLCLLSGGGSALLPAPAEGITLADKQQVTLALHHCGATIDEMNCVRKHLSDVKGGRLAQVFHGKALFSLILSDVIGDPLDVIASGPTAADPTTFGDALAVLDRHGLLPQIPASVLAHLERGKAGGVPETLKSLPPNVHNLVLGNNAKALAAARRSAENLGYRVLNLGSFLEGETQEVGTVLAGIVRSIRRDNVPWPPSVCVLSGGETTVTLGKTHGRGGRNQELVLAMALKLGASGLQRVVVLSGGTDGEDGPTDAAGAIADAGTLARASDRGLSPADYLNRHDAYSFFDATGDLFKTGLTQTNVMDVRVMLVR